jgi:hypothetical protein
MRGTSEQQSSIALPGDLAMIRLAQALLSNASPCPQLARVLGHIFAHVFRFLYFGGSHCRHKMGAAR